MKLLKLNLLIILVILFGISSINAQVVTTIPAFPSAGDSVTVVFDATLGNAGLEAYTDDIYAHTGLITNLSASPTDWKYVIAGWSENITKAQLVEVGEDLYHLQISPSIREFYGVPENETILQMAFVFRNADGSVTGRDVDGSDIYADVYEVGLNVKISTPMQESIFDIDETINALVEASEADSVFLYLNNVLVASDTGNAVEYNFSLNEEGLHWLHAKAKDVSQTINDSVFFYIKGNQVVEELPAGIVDGINYINANTVTLCLFAPNKDFVFVPGDFNDWKLYGESSTSYMMKQTPDGNRYWITLSELEARKEYIFQYYIDGEIKIADPYADKLSDPWNDHYIPDAVYPDLIEYPVGKTTEIASVFQTNQEDYVWEVTDFQPPAVDDLVIYELLVRDYTGNHDLKTVMDTLDYLQNLGVNVIELMPFNEFEGNDSWGYNPSFYFAPDKAYGTKNDCKRFIDECHKRGIAVFMDMVLNHTYGQSPFVRMYWNAELNRPSADNPWYNEEHNFQNPDAHWGNDFNHESLETQRLVDSINGYWMSEYHIDGFRFDFTKGFSNTSYGPSDWGSAYDADRIAILKRMADEIWKRNENAYVSFEHLSDNSEEKELAEYGILLWGNMNYAYNEATMAWHENGKSDLKWISYKERGWSVAHVVGYMESHDEERLMVKNMLYGNNSGDYDITQLYTALKRIELAASFFFTVPGPKMIWQFGELGYDKSIDFDCRVCPKPILWDYFDEFGRYRLYQVYQALIHLKLNNEAFKSTDFEMDTYNSTKSIKINHESMNVNILGNFDVINKEIDPEFQQTGYWYEYFSGDSIDVTNVNETMTFEPGEYRIYTTIRLQTPDIVEYSFDIDNNEFEFSIYPNPSNDYFTIDLNDIKNELVSVEIVNSAGQLVKSFATKDFINGNKLITWNGNDDTGSVANSGLYFCKVSTSIGIYTKKLIKY